MCNVGGKKGFDQELKVQQMQQFNKKTKKGLWRGLFLFEHPETGTAESKCQKSFPGQEKENNSFYCEKRNISFKLPPSGSLKLSLSKCTQYFYLLFTWEVYS